MVEGEREDFWEDMNLACACVVFRGQMGWSFDSGRETQLKVASLSMGIHCLQSSPVDLSSSKA